MRIADALVWYGQGQQLAWRSLRRGALGKAGLRSAVGAFARPLTTPSRYPEYAAVYELLDGALDLADPSAWLLDIGSPKLFALLVAARTHATVVATDIWAPAIDEAAALAGGLAPDAATRVRLGVMDARAPLPAALAPPGDVFAGAFSMSVIEHIEPDPGGDLIAVQRMADVVRPGGCVVISVPVDREARSEYRRSEIYGRAADDQGGRFFQRVYDATALRELCTSLSPRLVLDACVICEWPDHPLLRLQPRFPTAIGFAGASFPLLANRFVVSSAMPAIPDIRGPGDAILRLRRAAG